MQTFFQVHPGKKLKSLIKNKNLVNLLITLSFGFFILWFGLTFGPVIKTEIRYQSKKTLQALFGFDDWRQLIVPHVDYDFAGGSENRDYGIAIPTLFLDEPVVFNIDPNDPQLYQAALKKGIAHASSTAFPDNGGVGYYFAHSSSPQSHRQYNAIFYTLGKLDPEDAVYIWFQGKKYRYEVFETKVTTDQDLSFLQFDPTAVEAEEIIVLQTCWPPGTTLKRLLIFAKRAEL